MTEILVFNPSVVHAQQANRWSPQARIPNYDDLTGEHPPYLLADQNRTVHAFNTQALKDGSQAIVYRQWTLDQGWTLPIDILVSAEGDNIQILDALQDQAGVAHLVFVIGRDVYYSRAPLVHAGNASAWYAPSLAGNQVTFPSHAGIGRDSQGNLVILYAGIQDGPGLYVTYSSDEGYTWSPPAPVFLASDDDLVVLGINVHRGESGRLHAVWTVVNRTGAGVSGHYISLDIARREVTSPFTLDVATDDGVLSLGILTPAVFEYDGSVWVTYYNGNINGHWWRRSDDGGQTWSERMRVSPKHVGTNGAIAFVTDSNDRLHIFFGERIDDLNHGMWHSVWLGNGWAEPVPVVSGPQVRDRIGGNGFDPKAARAVVSQGNTVLVTWATDGFAGENGIWYAYTVLDAPELPVRPLPLPMIIPAVTPGATVTGALPMTVPEPSQVEANRVDLSDMGQAPVLGAPQIMLLIGLLPAALLVVLVIGLNHVFHLRRH